MLLTLTATLVVLLTQPFTQWVITAVINMHLGNVSDFAIAGSVNAVCVLLTKQDVLLCSLNAKLHTTLCKAVCFSSCIHSLLFCTERLFVVCILCECHSESSVGLFLGMFQCSVHTSCFSFSLTSRGVLRAQSPPPLSLVPSVAANVVMLLLTYSVCIVDCQHLLLGFRCLSMIT